MRSYPLAGLDLYTCGMVLEVDGGIASLGAGAACLGTSTECCGLAGSNHGEPRTAAQSRPGHSDRCAGADG